MKKQISFALLAGAMSLPLSASTLSFPDFSSASGLSVNGSAAITSTTDGTVARLTSSASQQAGSIIANTPVDPSTFSTSFQFRLTNPGGITSTGGDGFVFFLQPGGTQALGQPGGGLGYGGLTGPSLAVEFDTYQDGWDQFSNQVAILQNGDVMTLLGANGTANPMTNGDLWSASITYDGSTMNVSLADGSSAVGSTPLVSTSIDVAGLFGAGTNVYAGFAGATGDAWETSDVTNWQFTGGAADPANPSDPTATPEPASCLLMGLGLVGGSLALARKRLSKAAQL